jgi:hypothetical protein
MLLVPYERLTIKTALNVEEVEQRLLSVTAPEPYEEGIAAYPDFSKNCAFRGTVDKDTFCISPILSTSAKRELEIRGKVYGEQQETIIKIAITINPITWVFLLLVWFVGSFVFGGFSISKFTILTVIVGCFYSGILLIFQVKARLAKSELENILGVRITEPINFTK